MGIGEHLIESLEGRKGGHTEKALWTGWGIYCVSG